MRQDSLAQNAGSAEARREASAIAGGKKQLGKNPPAPSSTVTASNARSPGGGSPASVRVFLSYAWEDDDYRELVKKLATRLRKDGIEARLDAWHLNSLTIPEFMSREVRKANRIPVLCSPAYQRMVHAMEDGETISGVGWEHLLLTSAIWSGLKDRTQLDIALLRGKWSESAPTFLSSMVYVDLTDESTFEARYRVLLQRMHGRSECAPEVGPLPADIEPRPVEPLQGIVKPPEATAPDP